MQLAVGLQLQQQLGFRAWWDGFLADLQLVLKQQQPEALLDALWEQHK
jgi:hypothetical protein